MGDNVSTDDGLRAMFRSGNDARVLRAAATEIARTREGGNAAGEVERGGTLRGRPGTPVAQRVPGLPPSWVLPPSLWRPQAAMLYVPRRR